MLELDGKSEAELKEIIENANRELTAKISAKRSQTIAKIHELAASIGVTVKVVDATKGPGKGKVAPRYRNPSDPSQTWTGRGVMPTWMKLLVDAGRSKDDFLI